MEFIMDTFSNCLISFLKQLSLVRQDSISIYSDAFQYLINTELDRIEFNPNYQTIYNDISYKGLYSYLRVSPINFANGCSQVYILMTLIPNIISFISFNLSSVFKAAFDLYENVFWLNHAKT